MEREEESRGMSGMRCEKTRLFLAPLTQAQRVSFVFLLVSYGRRV
jgi:hypothetical protein